MRMICSDARTVDARKVALYPNQHLHPPPHVDSGALPSKSTDNHTPNHDVTRSTQDQSLMKDSQSHVAGEPEQAGQGVECEYDPLVEEAAIGLVAAGEDRIGEEVGEREEGEDCDEDEVGGRGGGGGGMGVMEIPGCY